MLRPLRVMCGRSEPHVRQKAVAKLAASGRSKREISVSPAVQRNWTGGSSPLVAHAAPLAVRQREQWQFTIRPKGRSTS